MQQVKQEPVFTYAETYTKRYVKCPICKDKTQGFYADHLIKEAKPNKPTTAGPWQCKECNNFFRFKIHTDGIIEIAQVLGEEPYIAALVLLKLYHEGSTIYAVAKTTHNAFDIQKSNSEEGESHLPYYYDEHTCPTNWTRNIIAWSDNGDLDPHGIFQFQRIITLEDAENIIRANNPEIKPNEEIDWHHPDQDNISLLFPETLGGTDLEGSVVDSVLSLEKPTPPPGRIGYEGAMPK